MLRCFQSSMGHCCCSVSHLCLTLWPSVLQHARVSCPSLSPGVWSNLYPLSVTPSNHLIFCYPLLLLPSVFPGIRVFFNESGLCIRWPKYWSFSFSISPFNEYSGLISFRIDWFGQWDIACPFLDSIKILSAYSTLNIIPNSALMFSIILTNILWGRYHFHSFLLATRAKHRKYLAQVPELISDSRNESESESCSVMSDSLWPHGLYSPWNSLGQKLEWVVFLFSRGSSQPKDRTQVSCIAGGSFTSWATREAQEYWSGWPIPSSADLPGPGIEPRSPALQADSSPAELWGKRQQEYWHSDVTLLYVICESDKVSL